MSESPPTPSLIAPEPWLPQEGPQEDAIDAAGYIDELLFGGARGGGKTSFTLGDFVQDIHQGSVWQGILFRRHTPELDEVRHQAMQMYPAYGGEFKVGRDEWHFPGGARLRFRHMEDLNDYTKYHGMAFGWVAFDDLGNWPDLTAYKAMMSTLRGAAQRKRFRSSANPGGIGHLAIKEHFQIGKYPGGYTPIYDRQTKMQRMYIPSKVTDNKILLESDPLYVNRLYASGDEQLVKAWVDGDWDAIVGSYFSMWDGSTHIIDPHPIDPSWPVYMGLDYGETNPTAGVLAAVDFNDTVLIFGEYSVPNRGAADHARALVQAIKANPWAHRRMPGIILADPSMWTKRHTGEAHLTRSAADTFIQNGIHLTKANNDRIPGWRVVMDALRHGRLKFFRGFTDNITEAIPTMQRDSNNPEDMHKGGNDHGVDALRYLMAHIYKPTPIDKVNINPFQGNQVLNLLRTFERRG